MRENIFLMLRSIIFEIKNIFYKLTLQFNLIVLCVGASIIVVWSFVNFLFIYMKLEKKEFGKISQLHLHYIQQKKKQETHKKTFTTVSLNKFYSI